MACLLWIQRLIDILSQFLQLFMQYLAILDGVITALECMCQNNALIDAFKSLFPERCVCDFR